MKVAEIVGIVYFYAVLAFAVAYAIWMSEEPTWKGRWMDGWVLSVVLLILGLGVWIALRLVYLALNNLAS